VNTSYKRLIVALALVLPAAALVSSPVLAASQGKTKTHHSSVHKASGHKSSSSSHKKSSSTTS
jgi:hypothetical protein